MILNSQNQGFINNKILVNHIIYQDEKLEKLGFNLPFIVKLSHNLMLYDLLDKVYFDSGEVMDKLWP